MRPTRDAALDQPWRRLLPWRSRDVELRTRWFAHIHVFMDRIRRFKADIFQALSNPTRLAVLDILRDGERPLGAIVAKLGIKQANLSQHLSILRTRRLVATRKAGNQVFYWVRDPLLHEVLDLMRRYTMSHLEEDQVLLRELKSEDLSA